jgi:hypothetical protein
MGYTPTISGSSIVFITQSGIYPHTTWYSSSNPDLIASGSASGYFSGSSRHFTYYSQSGSDLIRTYHTEANVNNSQGIPVGSASIFTSSFGAAQQYYVQQPSSSATQGFAINLEDDGSLSIFSTTSLGAGVDNVGLYISSSGRIGIGTDNPQEQLDIQKVTSLPQTTKIPGLAYSVSETLARNDSQITANAANILTKSPINNASFTGTHTVANLTASALISGSYTSGTHVLSTDLLVYGRITSRGSDVVIGEGSVSASGDIFATGSISGSNFEATNITASGDIHVDSGTGSFSHIITDGDTIEFRNRSSKAIEGSLKFDTTDGLQVRDASRNPMKIKADAITATSVMSTVHLTSSLFTTTAITASGNISASGYITTNSNITASGTGGGNISASGLVHANEVHASRISGSSRIDAAAFNTDGNVVFGGACAMAYDPAARTVTFTAGGRSVTLSLR